MGEHLARRGHEFGSVTGRPRRCGWFDAVFLRRSIINSSVSGLCMTKLDVLDGLDIIRICVGYRTSGGETVVAPVGAEGFAECEPVYIDMPGWKASTVGITRYEDLPENARRYLERIEELVGVPIDIISTGAERAHTIILRHPFD
jgi:adenylosuccinate synthase